MATVTCPHCGATLTVTVEAGGAPGLLPGGDPLIAEAMRSVGIGGRRYATLRPDYVGSGRRLVGQPGAPGAVAGAGWWAEGYDEARFEQPARQPTVAGDVHVPALQALISGAIAGAGALALFGGMALAWRWPWPAVVVPTIAATVGTVAALWFNLLEDSRRLLRRLEVYTTDRPDLERPAAAADRLDVMVAENRPDAPDDGRVYTGGRVTFHSLPVSRQRLVAVADEVDAGRRRWAARSLAGCAGLSAHEAAALVDAMLEAGFLRYRNGQKNHPAGHELTGAGRALLRRARGEGGGPLPGESA